LPPLDATCRESDEFWVPLNELVAADVSSATTIAVAVERCVNDPAALVATLSRRRYFPTTELSGEYINDVSPAMSVQEAAFVADVHAFH
jgi:hypothetical protein